MRPLIVFPYYLVWHYTRAILDFFNIVGNLIWFVYYYFSISVLFKTLFHPIRSLKQFSQNNFKNRGLFLKFLINIGLIGSGFVIRSLTILVGIISLILIIIIGITALIVWLVFPPLILFIMISSLIGIFKT